MRVVVLLLVGAVALAGCSRTNADGSHTVGVPGGRSINVAKQAPANLPPFAPLLPDAKVSASVQFGAGGVVSYTTDSKPDDVVAFYDRATDAAGVKQAFRAASTPTGATSAVYASEAGAGGEKHLTVSAQPEGTHTKVSLSYANGKPGA